ncbi:DUF4159 domain-containing protein [Calothrix sp. PCC 6303]|uniref:DUF4159 domain-containing protein n=1 Tax=Calothrix sp. PCC 6303 TaxID=1170562 RepID=UPI0002A04C55|nr:DUF4159 domain-containing protein [Calothrix sp. PCC 6303]AFZ01386.1 hypothetical protein Cal6303_2379 [Calothrix sp. PCC 6303]
MISIEPLQRLQVTDGLLLTANLWKQAHDYHRQRQNIYYQSLHQAGIVWGLGVHVIDAPEEVAGQYKDRRWLQIQPGLAIDGKGNPIIVPQALAFRIASEAPAKGSLTVYVIVNYVDPDKLQNQSDRQFVQETFRIDEKTTPPNGTEVELCRILLTPGEVELVNAPDVLQPGINNLDLRSRNCAQLRIQKQVVVTYLADLQKTNPKIVENLTYLLQSMTALYPAMGGKAIEVSSLSETVNKLDSDLLYLTYEQFLSLKVDEEQVQNLQQYLQSGANIFIEVEEALVEELSFVRQQLRSAIANLTQEQESALISQELEAELMRVEEKLQQQLYQIQQPIQELSKQFGIPITNFATLPSHHPLRKEPFLFSQMPTIKNYPIHLFNWGGIILIFGSLSSGWGIDENLSLSREIIRTTQEMGINILHFAWYRHQLIQSQK